MEEVLLICPNEEKMAILENERLNTNLNNIKFMTRIEFIKNYFFDYDYRAIQYLMDKYNYNLDVCKVYIKNMYPIDINKDYKSDKLIFLRNLKSELLDCGLLIENKTFKDYLSSKVIKLSGYYDLDKYIEDAIGCKCEVIDANLDVCVYEYPTMEVEVNNTCLKIIELLNNGVDINKIYLCNVSDDYLYTIHRLFKYYNIPINIDMNNSIYSTKVVRDYLDNGELDLDNSDNISITKSLVNVINSLVDLDKSKSSYRKILIDRLKSTKIPSTKYNNAVNVVDLVKSKFSEDDHVFVLGFNQDILPKMAKDVEYINDSIKNEVSMYSTLEINKRTKKSLIYILSNINNLYLSYKLSSPFSSFYPSSLINDLGLDVIKEDIDEYKYSDVYNKLRLSKGLDLFYKYGEVNDTLNLLNTHYNIPYLKYSNEFTGIDNNKYLEYLPKPLNLSYSTVNDYSECSFKYYLKNVLHLSLYEELFPQFLGNLYHNILSLYRYPDFDFEREYNNYLKDRELSLKEVMLLRKIKTDLIDLIESLKKQQLLTGYDLIKEEEKIVIEVPNKKISVMFKGFVDKIMYLEKNGLTYFSVVDYKTGTIDTNIEPMKYGLHLQLPVYLYLIKYSNLFSHPVFTGIYYQNILFNYPTCKVDGEYEKLCHDRLKLQGYSIDDVSILERFDSTYEKSEYIKSMNYNADKGFGTYSKVMSSEVADKMTEYTKKYLDKVTDDILDAKFDINPKHYNGENISCRFCSFKDICYMKEKDLKYLEKVEDLDFLD